MQSTKPRATAPRMPTPTPLPPTPLSPVVGPKVPSIVTALYAREARTAGADDPRARDAWMGCAR
jgi:hypothetical protein